MKSPDLAKSNLKRALLNNMKDYPGGIPDQMADEFKEHNDPIKKKGTGICSLLNFFLILTLKTPRKSGTNSKKTSEKLLIQIPKYKH